MSDFLNQFSNNEYKKKKAEVEAERKVESNNKTTSEDSTQSFETASSGSGISGSYHETDVDQTFHKRKVIRYVIIAATVIIVTLIVFIGMWLNNRVAVRDFVGTSIEEVRTWALQNRIELDIRQEFSLEEDENIIIAQDIEPNSRMSRGSILTITVSRGADPEELVVIPDFEEMTYAQIRAWIGNYRLLNTTIQFEFNAEIERNEFIRAEFRDTAVEADNFRRRDRLVIYVSRGEEVAERNITVPDFVGTSRSEVESWANERGVIIAVQEAGSQTIMAEHVISQSIPAGERVARGDTVTIVVSLGRGVTIPNFNNITRDEATMAGGGELAVTVRIRYHDTIPYGRLISQSVASGTVLFRDAAVEVIYSAGRPHIGALVGRSESEIPAYFFAFTAKGANITYEVHYVYSDTPRGEIIYANIERTFVAINTHVWITVSLGPAPPAE
ncbi:MAG: PASTA domain-containing protein [Oscillospiraceae bacterium]|nr:PASTA domain-containing protein [Oscillospiraceae bacterium]